MLSLDLRSGGLVVVGNGYVFRSRPYGRGLLDGALSMYEACLPPIRTGKRFEVTLYLGRGEDLDGGFASVAL